MLDELLTAQDCRFLKSIALPFAKNSSRLDLSSFTKEDILGYGIVFKVLSGKNLSSFYPSIIPLHFLSILIFKLPLFNQWRVSFIESRVKVSPFYVPMTRRWGGRGRLKGGVIGLWFPAVPPLFARDCRMKYYNFSALSPLCSFPRFSSRNRMKE